MRAANQSAAASATACCAVTMPDIRHFAARTRPQRRNCARKASTPEGYVLPAAAAASRRATGGNGRHGRRKHGGGKTRSAAEVLLRRIGDLTFDRLATSCRRTRYRLLEWRRGIFAVRPLASGD